MIESFWTRAISILIPSHIKKISWCDTIALLHRGHKSIQIECTPRTTTTMTRFALLLLLLLLLVQFIQHVDGDGLLRGILRHVDRKVRHDLRKRLIDRDSVYVNAGTGTRRLTSSGSSASSESSSSSSSDSSSDSDSGSSGSGSGRR